MRRPSRRTSALLGAATALTSGAFALGGLPAVAGITGSAPAAVVRPVPAVSGHIAVKHLSAPPTNAQCLHNYGIHCYNPLSYAAAYNLGDAFAAGDTGAGRTIAIVDSYGSPTIGHDLAVFDKTYGIPAPPSLRTIAPAGAIPQYDNSADRQGWAFETTLDVEYAHAFAPGANILVVATPVSETEGIVGFPEIVKAENYVISHRLADVISQSFGATENTFTSGAQLASQRSAFTAAQAAGITVLAASGDTGATDYRTNGTLYAQRVNSWPSSDPLVTSIGGTMLDLNGDGHRLAPDAAWNDGYGATGGGTSLFFPRPPYQDGVASITGNHRGTPDISMSAAVDGAAVIYDSFDPYAAGYDLVGGTSEATPIFAGVVADAAQLAGHSLGLINPALYAIGSGRGGIVDVTTGNNSFAGVTGYATRQGYDLATGLGTVRVAGFVKALAAKAG